MDILLMPAGRASPRAPAEGSPAAGFKRETSACCFMQWLSYTNQVKTIEAFRGS